MHLIYIIEKGSIGNILPFHRINGNNSTKGSFVNETHNAEADVISSFNEQQCYRAGTGVCYPEFQYFSQNNYYLRFSVFPFILVNFYNNYTFHKIVPP